MHKIHRQSGIATLVVITIVIVLIGLAGGGFWLSQRKAGEETTAQPGETPKKSVSPIVGIWGGKLASSYFYDAAGDRWIETSQSAEEKTLIAKEEYLRFREDGRMCQGELIGAEFNCTDQERVYTLSGDLLDLGEETTPPSRTRWSVRGDKLELVIEYNYQGTWVPTVKSVLMRYK